MHKKYAEYAVYVAAIFAVFAIVALPNGDISGEVIGHSISSDASLDALGAKIVNTDDFTWHNVNVELEDSNGFKYACPTMLYLKPGSTAVMDIGYCFSKTNANMNEEPVKLTIYTDEGSASFLY